MNNSLTMIVPAYVYPNPRDAWNAWIGAAPQVSHLIVNPASGPGASTDANYIAVIAQAKAAGITVLGYVDTNYTSVPLATAEANVDLWRTLYGVTEIFFDQVSTGLGAPLTYYTSLTNYVKAANAGAQIVLNFGTEPNEAYINLGTIMCVFEGTYDAYVAWTPPAWYLAYPRGKFYHLIYNAPDEAAMGNAIALADQRRAGYVFVADVSPLYTWGTIPIFFDEEVEALKLLRPVVGSLAEDMYLRMGPLTDQDQALGYPLLTYLGAIFDTYMQDIDDLVSDKPTYPGWASIMSPDTAPPYALGWLAQLVGVRLNQSLTSAQNIDLVKQHLGFQRGSPGAIIAAITPFLTGTKHVVLTERYTGDAYKVLVNTLTGEVPDSAKMQAAALSQKPAGILMTFTAQVGQTYTQLRTAKATYTLARSGYTDYNAMRNG